MMMMMNKSPSKAAIFTSQTNPSHLRAALFHSTPVLERKRRDSGSWGSRSSYYSRRSRKLYSKQSLLQNVSGLADYLFQRWQNGFDEEGPSSSRGPSRIRKEHYMGSRRRGTDSQHTRHWTKKAFQFYEDDFEVETFYRSPFYESGYFYWNFINEETPRWRSSFGYSSTYGRRWRQRVEEDYTSSSESDNSESYLISERRTLGLNSSGPLRLEDVKNAYRACALKWHPDRHHGSSKVSKFILLYSIGTRNTVMTADPRKIILVT
ncbi:hypothetical protein K2173_025143 [Erythroxylum novogranatense]|uniref:J domain-containing protein n=1 Tax=Erythroxylum novogranatense TaxID=1862640 RepID=A0AAV8SWF5_9ROSI|nr:hypothetical protein K2173_025143 [Erythroxylum novogranatense]